MSSSVIERDRLEAILELEEENTTLRKRIASLVEENNALRRKVADLHSALGPPQLN